MLLDVSQTPFGQKISHPMFKSLGYIEQDHNLASCFNFNPSQPFNTNPKVVKLIFSSNFPTSQLQLHIFAGRSWHGGGLRLFQKKTLGGIPMV